MRNAVLFVLSGAAAPAAPFPEPRERIRNRKRLPTAETAWMLPPVAKGES